jgi:large subunit ribosomal protein L13
MKTTLRQNVQNTDRQWWIVDAEGKTLGQLAVAIADTLRGKRRVDFTPHVDGGDYVVVLNAEKVAVTGKKEEDKKYYRHSGVLGKLKTQSLSEVREKSPKRILEDAVGGMLPKTRLRTGQMKRLLLVIGDQNPHAAQQAKPLEL